MKSDNIISNIQNSFNLKKQDLRRRIYLLILILLKFIKMLKSDSKKKVEQT